MRNINGNWDFMRILLVTLALTSCVATKSKDISKTMELKSEQGGFQFQTPINWSYYKLQGVDSYVGEIVTGEKDTLYFDMGRYSAPLDHPLYRNRSDEDDEENYKSKVAWRNLNGYTAKFASHWTKTKSDYGVYFDSLWIVDNSTDWRDKIKLTIYGFNLSKKTKNQLEISLQSIKFNKP
ncbi:MAG TPA: hypothetical protein VHZ50_04695 [Puia sp.]|nr:hypothetical protein [Puia sp.]